MTDLISNYRDHQLLSLNEWGIIGDKLKVQNLKAGDYWLSEGKTCHYIGHIEKGILRTFYVDNDGNKRTILFHFPNNVITEFESFYNQTPSRFYIECVSDCIIHSMNYEDREALMENIPNYESVALGITEDYLLFLVERMINLTFLSAEERYLRLLEFEPQIGKFLSLGCIAEYLNIKPQSLSRIRKKMRESIN